MNWCIFKIGPVLVYFIGVIRKISFFEPIRCDHSIQKLTLCFITNHKVLKSPDSFLCFRPFFVFATRSCSYPESRTKSIKTTEHSIIRFAFSFLLAADNFGSDAGLLWFMAGFQKFPEKNKKNLYSTTKITTIL